jgi:hypothetical protein
MNKCRVFELIDGRIGVLTLNLKHKKEKESITDFLDRETKKNGFSHLPYFDTTTDKLPDRSQRDKWAMAPDKKSVIIDNTKETDQDLKDQIGQEYIKPEGQMNTEKIFRLKAKLAKSATEKRNQRQRQ